MTENSARLEESHRARITLNTECMHMQQLPARSWLENNYLFNINFFEGTRGKISDNKNTDFPKIVNSIFIKLNFNKIERSMQLNWRMNEEWNNYIRWDNKITNDMYTLTNCGVRGLSWNQFCIQIFHTRNCRRIHWLKENIKVNGYKIAN